MADSHHSLSLTQTSERSPHIFVDASGSPLSVYLDVNPEIPSRPRLTRLLRASGADICHNLSVATILLVNRETESGLKLVHDWRADSHKTVLDYEWIQACLQNRRALLELDHWGGFRLEHASECMYCNGEGDEDLEEDVQSGIPSKASRYSTRPKPSSQGVMPNKPSLPHHFLSSSSRGASISTPAHTPSSNVTSSAIAPSSPQPAAGTSTEHTPKRRYSTPTSHHHTHTHLTSSQQGSAPPPSYFSQTTPPTLTPLLPQASGPSVLQSQHSNPAGVDLLHALNYAFQIQNTASQVQNAASQTLTQLVETVIAVAQGQGMDTALIQSFLASLPMSSSVTQQPPPSNEHEPVPHFVDEHPGSSVSDSPLRDRNKSSASTHASRSVVPPEPSLPAKRRRKSLDSPFPAKRVAPDTRQSQSAASLEPLRSEKGVFSTKNGRPLLVFVQIDTRGRHEIVHLIKKNGGKITADIPTAAFVILNPRSVTYTDLRQEAVDSGRTIVQASFITESVKQGHLLDPHDFLTGDAGSPRKLHSGGRRPTSVRGRHSPESEHATSETPTSDTVVNASTSMPTRERSVTPEPPTPVQSKSGYRFTPAEMTCAWALVRRVISKDPMANKSMVTRALHKKMPHHPESSWLSTISRQKDMYEAVRTEALGLALGSGPHPPDTQQQRGNQHPQNEIDDADMDEPRNTEELEELQVGASLILTEGEPVRDDEQESSPEGKNEDTHERDDAYARDFEAIVEFLTSTDTNFEGQDGAEIFRHLTAKSTCITAPSWPDFVERHGKAVEQEVGRRYAAQQTIESAVDP